MVMHEIEVEGFTIGYQRVGEGPPLVLLHGYVGEGGATWWPQLEALCDEFTVVVWDVPGSGRSSDPPETFSLADYADRLAAFIEALRLERPHVAGVSFGGGLALELYRRHPSIPRSLILVSAYAGWPGSLPPEEVDRRLRQALELSELPPDRLVDEVIPTLFSPSVPAEIVDRFADSMRRFHPVGLRAMSRSFAAADVRDVLPRVAVPALLVYGDGDVRAPMEVADALHRAIRDSELVVVPGAGHVVNLEAPERFNAEVRRFLRSVSA